MERTFLLRLEIELKLSLLPKKSPDGLYAKKRTTSIPIPISETGAPTNLPRHQQVSFSLGTYPNPSIPFEDDDDIHFIEDEFDEEFDVDSANTSLNMSTGTPKVESLAIEKEISNEPNNHPSNNSSNYGNEDLMFGGDQTESSERFIPPHELLANSKKDFNVGTAQSVAVWEQRRRKFI